MLPFFLSDSNRINSKLVYALLEKKRKEINLIQGEQRTKPSFTLPLQADNCKDSENPMHTGTKAGDADNSI